MQDLLIQVEDALATDSARRVAAKRKQLETIVDDLLKLPRGTERWKEALKLYVQFNLSATPGLTAAEEVYYVTRENNKSRESQLNKFGKSDDKNSDIRKQMNMPTGFKTLLNIVDPEINTKENLLKLRKVFPMFVIAEVF